MNLDECKSIGTHLIALLVNGNNATYFYSFSVGYISKEIEKIIGDKNIMTKNYKIQGYDSECVDTFVKFADFTMKRKSLLDYTNLFSHYGYKRNNKIILRYFQ